MKIWTEISEERLTQNFAALQMLLSEEESSTAGSPSLLAVVKANAYGHGIEPCARILTAAGARWLGVTDAHEGARVRAALGGVAGTAAQGSGREEPQILVMSGTMGLPGEAECAVQSGLTVVAWEQEHVARIAEAARAGGEGRPVRIHLEVDTGMSRQGARPGRALEAVVRAIAEERSVTLDGVFTHFSSTEVAESTQTAAQQRCFESAIEQIWEAGIRPQWVHAGNSSYIDNAAGCGDPCGRPMEWIREVAERVEARAMVRSGLALYGYVLPIEGASTSRAGTKVRPVMSWKTRVIAMREVQAGEAIGYNETFVAERMMRLALLPVGYADGLRRELSSTNASVGGWVMIRGIRAPIVGRVSMNLTTVDVSGISGAMEGDEAVLLGEGVSADDHAQSAGTIPYEILCAVRTSE